MDRAWTGSTKTIGAARRVLALAAGAQPLPAQLLSELADGVLESEAVRVARIVRGGGPYAVRAAIRLSALILSDADFEPRTEVVDDLG